MRMYLMALLNRGRVLCGNFISSLTLTLLC
jgi:hypothetical protein